MTVAFIIAGTAAAVAAAGWVRALRRGAELERVNHRQRIRLGLAFTVARLPRMTAEDFREWAER